MAATLPTLREKLDKLTAEDGDFAVACADTGDSPVPLTGARFESEDDAQKAAELAHAYREQLRETDPDLPERSLTVYETASDPLTLVSTREPADGRRENGLPRSSRSVTLSGDDEHEWLRMDNAPLVHVSHDGDPLDDAAIERQLDAKL